MVTSIDFLPTSAGAVTLEHIEDGHEANERLVGVLCRLDEIAGRNILRHDERQIARDRQQIGSSKRRLARDFFLSAGRASRRISKAATGASTSSALSVGMNVAEICEYGFRSQSQRARTPRVMFV
jgi:hypothetical protein